MLQAASCLRAWGIRRFYLEVPQSQPCVFTVFWKRDLAWAGMPFLWQASGVQLSLPPRSVLVFSSNCALNSSALRLNSALQ